MAQSNLPQPPPTKDGLLDRWLFLLWQKTTTAASILWNQIILPTEPANTFLAGPTTGADAQVAFRALVAADLPAGTGTVTSVALSATPSGIFDVSGSPVTTSGTLALSMDTQTANTVLAGPTTGSAAVPSFRALVTADLPAGTGTVTSVDVSGGTTGLTFSGGPITTSGTITMAGTLDEVNGGTGQSSYAVGDILYASTTTALSKLADVAVGSYMRSGGVNTAPLWSTLVLPNAATANYIPYATSTNTWGESANLQFNGTTLTTTGFNNTGNTTLGDTSGDTLTINAGTWTIGNNVTSTRAVGAAAAGNQTLLTETYTFTGDAGGTSTVTASLVDSIFSGANNGATITGIQGRATHSGSATATLVRGVTGTGRNISTGTVTNLQAHAANLVISSSGNVTTGAHYLVNVPTLSSTGGFTTLYGSNCEDIGHATLVGTAIGFRCANLTAASTLTAGFLSAVSSGTGKWAFLSTGTANSGHAGNYRFGSATVAPVNTVDITGSLGRGAPVTKTGDFTVAATENWLINNKSGSACSVTLPTASSWTGREIMIQSYQAHATDSASSNVVPLGGGAAGTAILAATAGKWATLVSDGSNWIVMQGN